MNSITLDTINNKFNDSSMLDSLIGASFETDNHATSLLEKTDSISIHCTLLSFPITFTCKP